MEELTPKHAAGIDHENGQTDLLATADGLIILQKPEEETQASSIWRTILSMGTYVALYVFLFKSNLIFALVLIAILLFHELGHFIAMKLFGYKDVAMFFVPLVGAYVRGETSELKQSRRVIVILAGPLPGLLLGCGLLWLQPDWMNYNWVLTAKLLIGLNAFNLLPVLPLDGGQLLETLFTKWSRPVQLFFYGLSVALIIWYAVYKSQYQFLILAALPLMRIFSNSMVMKVRQQAEEKGLDVYQSYDDLNDEEYTRLRFELINTVPQLGKYETDSQGPDEEKLVPWVKMILLPYIINNMNWLAKGFVLLLWGGSLYVTWDVLRHWF